MQNVRRNGTAALMKRSLKQRALHCLSRAKAMDHLVVARGVPSCEKATSFFPGTVNTVNVSVEVLTVGRGHSVGH